MLPAEAQVSPEQCEFRQYASRWIAESPRPSLPVAAPVGPRGTRKAAAQLLRDDASYPAGDSRSSFQKLRLPT